MVDEGFVTVGSINGSRMYGWSSESGGEVRVTGWWQQVVNATGIHHLLPSCILAVTRPNYCYIISMEYI